MQKSIKVSKEIWKILTNIKIREDRNTLGDVVFDLLVKAKEVEGNVTQSYTKPD